LKKKKIIGPEQAGAEKNRKKSNLKHLSNLCAANKPTAFTAHFGSIMTQSHQM